MTDQELRAMIRDSIARQTGAPAAPDPAAAFTAHVSHLRLPLVRGGHEAWRYTLMSGVIPAIPLIIIRPFLPESPTWRAKKQARGCCSCP